MNWCIKREEIDILQANVEVLTDRININAFKNTSNIDDKVVSNNNYNNDDLANYQSSPQQQYLDNNNDITNYSQNNEDFNHSTTNYEPQNLVTATKAPPNSSTEKYSNDMDEDESFFKSTLNTNNVVEQNYSDDPGKE
jgi:hypothetical protein